MANHSFNLDKNGDQQFIISETDVWRQTKEQACINKIPIEDIESIAIHSQVAHSAGIKAGSNYHINIESRYEILSLRWGSFIGIGDDRSSSQFNEIVAQLQTTIFPVLLKNLLAKLEAGEQIKFGNISLSKRGFSKKQFLFGTKFLSIKSSIIELSNGVVVIQESGYKENHRWETIALTKENAILLPSLISILKEKK